MDSCELDTAFVVEFDNHAPVGKIDNMDARLITRFQDVTAEGRIIGLAVWKVPPPVPPTGHGYKYRCVYIVQGIRILGFNNERGKGDHRHDGAEETPYVFRSVDQLIEDFIAAIEARRTEQ